MKKITKVGVYKGLSYPEYDAIPALRSTYLKKHLHSPAMCLEPDEETKALIFGNAAHVGVLEGLPKLYEQYQFIPPFDGDKRVKEYRSLKESAALAAEAGGKRLLDDDEHKAILGIKKNISLHPTAKDMLKSEPEVVVVWKDKATGLLCKVRLDGAPFDYNGHRVIPDLKTTDDASESGFARAIKKYHYWFSAAMYLIGASIGFKETIDHFVFVAGEKERPYKVESHELMPSYIELGTAMFHSTLQKELECRKSGVYPAYLCAGIIAQEKPTYLLAE
jgi:exodeoxyribonuclease VIII